MCYYSSRNYRIIRVMFWSFPYLLWQAFGDWSGFLVGVMVAVILTTMFNNLFRANNLNMTSTARQRPLHTAEFQPRRQEEDSYSRGYQAEAEVYHAGSYPNHEGEVQPQYEEMQVPYPEMPPMGP
ncbi:hypothetical protein KDA_68060 [Dictyobacter alpinus]|uniref:Uncharacterized protein n=1 Tax=Dictyobacter alpinus TaxID=2014873 RepID=A0A402BJ81_9CHLR|nr:hypothetical protein [Dictyobacter alpinus]GCE31322.1 hypothetical protein KDA_68060 [Dictyobacter alpinus]